MMVMPMMVMMPFVPPFLKDPIKVACPKCK